MDVMLEKGDFVVHIDHGIGQYIEITTLTKNGLKKDYIKLVYADGDVLFGIFPQKLPILFRHIFAAFRFRAASVCFFASPVRFCFGTSGNSGFYRYPQPPKT